MNCKKCNKPASAERVSGRSSEMRCVYCKNIFTNEEANELLGVKENREVIDGQLIKTYENVGDKFDKFPSWYCLKFFDTYEERNEHDKKYHKVGDFMMGCIPSGFDANMEVKCGD